MKRFNIRVYGLWIDDGAVLLGGETVQGKEILKFPGGGLEFGEGTIDCLKREWMEELNCPIQVLNHFYTTDYFQPSAFDNSQVISIYYEVCPTVTLHFPVYNGREHFFKRAIDEDLIKDTSLPIDKIVAKMLLDRINK